MIKYIKNDIYRNKGRVVLADENSIIEWKVQRKGDVYNNLNDILRQLINIIDSFIKEINFKLESIFFREICSMEFPDIERMKTSNLTNIRFFSFNVFGRLEGNFFVSLVEPTEDYLKGINVYLKNNVNTATILIVRFVKIKDIIMKI